MFVNGKEIHKFKVKDSEIVATPLCSWNISGDMTGDNMKKTGLYDYVHDFSVNYNAIPTVFDSNLDKKIDKKLNKNIDIYYIGYITIKKIGDYENIHNVNPLYLIIGEVDGHIEEKVGVNI